MLINGLKQMLIIALLIDAKEAFWEMCGDTILKIH
jgi:hypothetical protein